LINVLFVDECIGVKEKIMIRNNGIYRLLTMGELKNEN